MIERELRVLRTLANELRALHEVIHAVAVAASRQPNDDTNNNQPVQPLPVVITHTPQLDPARCEYYESQNRESRSLWRTLKPWVETIGVIVALFLAGFNLLTLLEIQRQTPFVIKSADVASKSLVLSQRVYLKSDDPQSMLGGYGLLKLPLINYGHVPCHWFKAKVNYGVADIASVLRGDPNHPVPVKLVDERSITVSSSKFISPNVDHWFMVKLPPLPKNQLNALRANRISLIVRVKFEYDTGFNSSDTVETCAAYSGAVKRWVSCGSGSTDVDLSTSSKNAQ